MGVSKWYTRDTGRLVRCRWFGNTVEQSMEIETQTTNNLLLDTLGDGPGMRRLCQPNMALNQAIGSSRTALRWPGSW